MSDQRRSRTGTRRTTLAVLGILKTSTSLGNPISISKIVERLKSEYDIATHRDSVKDILEDLMEYYPGPEKICCKRSKEGRSYQFDYYCQTEISGELQENLQKIEQAIKRNREGRTTRWLLSFQFNGYGSDHRLHPTGKIIRDVYPVRVLEAYGHRYLVGFFSGRQDASHFRVDLMSCIRGVEVSMEKDHQRDFRINQIAAEDYRTSHLCMFYERPGERSQRIRLRVKKIPGKPEASLTFLQDNFGKYWEPISQTENDQEVEVWVKCLPGAMVPFVRQYIDRVRVLEPEEVAKKVDAALREDFESYFCDKF